jgi:hypothetical protein
MARTVGARLASLDSERMFADPSAALSAVSAHYGLSLDDETALRGPAFTQHSKSGVDYSAEVRAADYAKVRAAHGEEIDMVLAWAKAVADTASISMDAPNPLLKLQS